LRWTFALVFTLGACARQESPPAPPSPPAPSTTAAAPAPAASVSQPEAPAQAAPGKGCDPERLQATVRVRRDAISACYRRFAEKDPSLAGKIVLQLGINTEGRLINRSVWESDFPLELNACIVGALEGLQFPGEFAEPCITLYPFSFTASVRGAPKAADTEAPKAPSP
jgi:hypothetical protein